MTLRSKRKELDLDVRLGALEEALAIADGRLDQGDVALAKKIRERAGDRLALGAELTVVALAGPTGSGKSTLFNALAGTDLSEVGVLRPTTGEAHACVWGDDSADALLDWLAIGRRHRLASDDADLDGMVLLDLPDHDSTEQAHRLEVDRLIELVDLFVWVVDPQKYADAALHDRYLRPLATHADVMVAVMNQADRLEESEVTTCIADLKRLLDKEGLPRVSVIAASAMSGEGLGELREILVQRVAARRAAAKKLAADLDLVASWLGPYCGSRPKAKSIDSGQRSALVDALSAAAGVERVAGAVAEAHRHEAKLATGWPFTRWLRRFRAHPLRRLHLGDSNVAGGRTSLPGPSPVQRARVESGLRSISESSSAQLPPPWPALVRKAVAETQEGLTDELDRTVAFTPLPTGDRPLWWKIASALQTLLATAAIVGFLWLGVLFALEWLQVPRPPLPRAGRIPVPTLLLVGGLLTGFVLAAVSAQLARVGAARRKRTAQRALVQRLEALADERVVARIDKELDAYERFCAALRRITAA